MKVEGGMSNVLKGEGGAITPPLLGRRVSRSWLFHGQDI